MSLVRLVVAGGLLSVSLGSSLESENSLLDRRVENLGKSSKDGTDQPSYLILPDGTVCGISSDT